MHVHKDAVLGPACAARAVRGSARADIYLHVLKFTCTMHVLCEALKTHHEQSCAQPCTCCAQHQCPIR